MKRKDIVRGDFIISLAGRDRGGIFIVMSVEGEYAFIADGMRRSVAKPKKKKLRHLQPTGDLPYTGGYTDSEMRRAVRAVHQSVIVN